jgi:hypothetical protein
MLDSLSIAWQAVLWPLFGAVAILITARVLPQWAHRLLAVASAVAPLVVLRAAYPGLSLEAAQQRAEIVGRAELVWQPLNLFRMSPTLQPDGMALVVVSSLTWLAAALLLGIQARAVSRIAWQAGMLIALAGCLGMAMAANVLTLAMGSALIDMALALMILTASDGLDRTLWRMLVPGVASTLVLLLSALHMDGQVGTASLLARSVPAATLLLLGLAALVRMLVFPLHPRGKAHPETIAAFLLLAGIGIGLLARVRGIASGSQGSLGLLAEQWPWMPFLAWASLILGGMVVWAGGLWPGIAVHQLGQALAFLTLTREATPWPALSLLPAVGILAIWWSGDGLHLHESAGWVVPIARRLRSWRGEAEPSAPRARAPWVRRFPIMAGLGGSSVRRYAPSLLTGLALGSLAGLPLLAGSITRWHLYGALLHAQYGWMLVALLAADILLVAGLWPAAIRILRGPTQHADHLPHALLAKTPPAPSSGNRSNRLLAMLSLVLPLLILGIAPGSLGLRPQPLGVSVWGQGLLVALPWLLGGWLARASLRLGDHPRVVENLAGLGWLFRAANWTARQLTDGLHWLGQVGEGEGWWGWALIILLVGAMLFMQR